VISYGFPTLEKGALSASTRFAEGHHFSRAHAVATEMLRTSQAETGDFGRTVQAERNEHFADTTADVYLRAIQPIPTLDEALAELRPALPGADHRQAYLPAVGVAGDHEVDTVRDGAANSQRVVAKQDFGIARGYGTHRRRKIIRSPPKIINPNDPKRRSTRVKGKMGIAQHANALCPQRFRDLIRIDLEVVIPEDRKDAQPCAQFSQRPSRGPDIGGRKRHVVASQSDKVRPLAIRQVDGALDVFERSEKAVVNVRQLNNFQTVVLAAQPS